MASTSRLPFAYKPLVHTPVASTVPRSGPASTNPAMSMPVAPSPSVLPSHFGEVKSAASSVEAMSDVGTPAATSRPTIRHPYDATQYPPVVTKYVMSQGRKTPFEKLPPSLKEYHASKNPSLSLAHAGAVRIPAVKRTLLQVRGDDGPHGSAVESYGWFQPMPHTPAFRQMVDASADRIARDRRYGGATLDNIVVALIDDFTEHGVSVREAMHAVAYAISNDRRSGIALMGDVGDRLTRVLHYIRQSYFGREANRAIGGGDDGEPQYGDYDGGDYMLEKYAEEHGEDGRRERERRSGVGGARGDAGGSEGGFSGSTPLLPPMLRSHIPLQTRQYHKFYRTYESDWNVWEPFKGSPGAAFSEFWQYDGQTSTQAGAAYDTWAFSFSWRYGAQTSAGNVPLIVTGKPQPTPPSISLTPTTYAIGEGNWGQACSDLAILSQVLQYWRVPKIEIMVERLPESTNVASLLNTAGNQPGTPMLPNTSYGYFVLAPWAGDPGWFLYDGVSGSPDTIVGSPNKINLTGGYASNMWGALQTSAWKYHKKHDRLAKNTQHPDYIHMTVAPTMPTFVQTTTDAGVVATLQGYQGPQWIDIYDWAQNNIIPQGFCGKVMWIFDAPLSNSTIGTITYASYQALRYRVKFRMVVEAMGAQPWDEALIVANDIQRERMKLNMEGLTATAKAVQASRQQAAQSMVNLCVQEAKSLNAPTVPGSNSNSTQPDGEDSDFEDLLHEVKRQKISGTPSSQQQQQASAR